MEQQYDIEVQIKKVRQREKGYFKCPRCCVCKRYFKIGEPLYLVSLLIGSSIVEITSICLKCWKTKEKLNIYLGKGDIQ